MKIIKVTPLLIVDRVEPALAFWVDRLGYKKLAEVPHGDALGFALLEGSAGEVMLQSRASIADDLPIILEKRLSAVLYAEVDSLEGALAAVKGAEVLAGPRSTFYGAREACVLDPAGHAVVLSQQGAA
jgi:uncharacterized glyoxalase superfamily protein PhnB